MTLSEQLSTLSIPRGYTFLFAGMTYGGCDDAKVNIQICALAEGLSQYSLQLTSVDKALPQIPVNIGWSEQQIVVLCQLLCALAEPAHNIASIMQIFQQKLVFEHKKTEAANEQYTQENAKVSQIDSELAQCQSEAARLAEELELMRRAMQQSSVAPHSQSPPRTITASVSALRTPSNQVGASRPTSPPSSHQSTPESAPPRSAPARTPADRDQELDNRIAALPAVVYMMSDFAQPFLDDPRDHRGNKPPRSLDLSKLSLFLSQLVESIKPLPGIRRHPFGYSVRLRACTLIEWCMHYILIDKQMDASMRREEYRRYLCEHVYNKTVAKLRLLLTDVTTSFAEPICRTVMQNLTATCARNLPERSHENCEFSTLSRLVEMTTKPKVESVCDYNSMVRAGIDAMALDQLNSVLKSLLDFVNDSKHAHSQLGDSFQMMSPRKQSGIREIEPRQKIVKEMGELVAELNEDIKSNPFKRTFEPGDDDTKSLVAYLDYLNTILLQLYSGFWGADYA